MQNCYTSCNIKCWYLTTYLFIFFKFTNILLGSICRRVFPYLKYIVLCYIARYTRNMNNHIHVHIVFLEEVASVSASMKEVWLTLRNVPCRVLFCKQTMTKHDAIFWSLLFFPATINFKYKNPLHQQSFSAISRILALVNHINLSLPHLNVLQM